MKRFTEGEERSQITSFSLGTRGAREADRLTDRFFNCGLRRPWLAPFAFHQCDRSGCCNVVCGYYPLLGITCWRRNRWPSVDAWRHCNQNDGRRDHNVGILGRAFGLFRLLCDWNGFGRNCSIYRID
jgi:hypothetical protein